MNREQTIRSQEPGTLDTVVVWLRAVRAAQPGVSEGNVRRSAAVDQETGEPDRRCGLARSGQRRGFVGPPILRTACGWLSCWGLLLGSALLRVDSEHVAQSSWNPVNSPSCLIRQDGLSDCTSARTAESLHGAKSRAEGSLVCQVPRNRVLGQPGQRCQMTNRAQTLQNRDVCQLGQLCQHNLTNRFPDGSGTGERLPLANVGAVVAMASVA